MLCNPHGYCRAVYYLMCRIYLKFAEVVDVLSIEVTAKLMSELIKFDEAELAI